TVEPHSPLDTACARRRTHLRGVRSVLLAPDQVELHVEAGGDQRRERSHREVLRLAPVDGTDYAQAKRIMELGPLRRPRRNGDPVRYWGDACPRRSATQRGELAGDGNDRGRECGLEA